MGFVPASLSSSPALCFDAGIKPTPEAALIIAQAMLAGFVRDAGPPEAIAFWEEAVRDCEDEMAKHALQEKPE